MRCDNRIFSRNVASIHRPEHHGMTNRTPRQGETMPELSPRLATIVNALPLKPGMRVLEIGGAPGAAARAVCQRIAPDGHILVIDRSAKGIALTERNAAAEIANGLLSTRHVAVEDFTLLPGETPFDLAFAIRVGTLDGRHPEGEAKALNRISAALRPEAPLYIDGGTPLRTFPLDYVRPTK